MITIKVHYELSPSILQLKTYLAHGEERKNDYELIKIKYYIVKI